MFTLLAFVFILIGVHRWEGNLPHGSAVITMVIGCSIDVLVCITVAGLWYLLR